MTNNEKDEFIKITPKQKVILILLIIVSSCLFVFVIYSFFVSYSGKKLIPTTDDSSNIKWVDDKEGLIEGVDYGRS